MESYQSSLTTFINSFSDQLFSFLIVIDYEATCWQDQKYRQHEISRLTFSDFTANAPSAILFSSGNRENTAMIFLSCHNISFKKIETNTFRDEKKSRDKTVLHHCFLQLNFQPFFLIQAMVI